MDWAPACAGVTKSTKVFVGLGPGLCRRDGCFGVTPAQAGAQPFARNTAQRLLHSALAPIPGRQPL
jgi:hypothetical protein